MPTSSARTPHFVGTTPRLEDHNAVSPFEFAASALRSDEVAKMLDCLDGRERDILSLRFGIDGGRSHTLHEVGFGLGLAGERLRQIEAKAMSKLRHPGQATMSF